jgi:hypothetical protein
MCMPRAGASRHCRRVPPRRAGCQAILDLAASAWDPQSDGLIAACLNFRSHLVIDTLEARIGKPVVISTQAALWHLLQLAGIKTPIHGFGLLLREHQHARRRGPVVAKTIRPLDEFFRRNCRASHAVAQSTGLENRVLPSPSTPISTGSKILCGPPCLGSRLVLLRSARRATYLGPKLGQKNRSATVGAALPKTAATPSLTTCHVRRAPVSRSTGQSGPR